jgi:hypothetical protein
MVLEREIVDCGRGRGPRPSSTGHMRSTCGAPTPQTPTSGCLAGRLIVKPVRSRTCRALRTNDWTTTVGARAGCEFVPTLRTAALGKTRLRTK